MKVKVQDRSKKAGEMIVKSINLKRYAIPFNTPFECDRVLYSYLTENVPFQKQVERDGELVYETDYRPRCDVALIQE